MSHVRRILATTATAAGLVVALVAGSLAPASALPAWVDHSTTWTNPDARSPRVVDLRYARHDTFDRVVIEIRGAIPGGHARYGKHFHYDGSGAPVPIKGRSGIHLVLTPAQAHDNDGNDVYDGPAIARPHFDTLKALAFTGDFEGYVSFGFALTHRAPYRIFKLHDPQRLVIDFRHE